MRAPWRLIISTTLTLHNSHGALIESGAGVLKATDALCDPQPKGCDIVEHLGAERCNRILDARWYFGEDFAGDESVAFEAA